MSFKTPSNLKYLNSHEWILIEGDTATIGITDYAQDSLGDVVYVDLPAVGDRFAAGSTFGAVESVKASSDLYVPAGGTVIARLPGLTVVGACDQQALTNASGH